MRLRTFPESVAHKNKGVMSFLKGIKQRAFSFLSTPSSALKGLVFLLAVNSFISCEKSIDNIFKDYGKMNISAEVDPQIHDIVNGNGVVHVKVTVTDVDAHDGNVKIVITPVDECGNEITTFKKEYPVTGDDEQGFKVSTPKCTKTVNVEGFSDEDPAPDEYERDNKLDQDFPVHN